MSSLTHAQIGRPAAEEYSPGQQGYVSLAMDAPDLMALLASQPETYRALVGGISEEAAATRPAPGEWSVKEVLGHVADAERVFGYRCICIARGEAQTLPPFDHEEYVEKGGFNQRSLASLLDEFDLQRQANLLAIGTIPAEMLTRISGISNYQQSVRALIHIMAGHAQHHIVSFQTDYGLV